MFNSATFDDFKFDSSLTEGETRKRHRNLSIATLLAIIVHLFLFFYWRFEVTQANNSVVIKVELVPEEVMLKEEPAPFIQPKYIEKPLASTQRWTCNFYVRHSKSAGIRLAMYQRTKTLGCWLAIYTSASITLPIMLLLAIERI